MSSQSPSVDLDALVESIKESIKEKFQSLKTVDDYLHVHEIVKVPAVALEISDIDSASDDSGTGQWNVEISFSAYCIISYKTQDGIKAKRRAASLAAAVAAFVKAQTWGAPVGVATQIHAEPAFWRRKEKDDEYECWAVSWCHAARFGEDEWDEDGPPARQVYVGFVPNIGAAHEADYCLLGEGEPDPVPANPDLPTP